MVSVDSNVFYDEETEIEEEADVRIRLLLLSAA